MRARELKRLEQWRGQNGAYADPEVVDYMRSKLRRNPRHKHKWEWSEVYDSQSCVCGAYRRHYGDGHFGEVEYDD